MINKDYLRNVVFGFEDGFVSIVGSIVGIAASAPDSKYIIVSGLVVIVVGAISMGIGSYLSEKSVHEIENNWHTDNEKLGGLLIWGAYMVAGLSVLTPYIVLPDRSLAMVVSGMLTLVGLFFLGFFKSRAINGSALRGGLEMVLVAGIAIVAGFGIGKLGSFYLES